jgi:hypothetical protein
MVPRRSESYFEERRRSSDQALTEILCIVSNYMFVARITRTGRVPLDDELANESATR